MKPQKKRILRLLSVSSSDPSEIVFEKETESKKDQKGNFLRTRWGNGRTDRNHHEIVRIMVKVERKLSKIPRTLKIKKKNKSQTNDGDSYQWKRLGNEEGRLERLRKP